VDDDLDHMSRDQLIAEVRKLLLPDRTDPVPTVPTWPEFLRGCLRYRESLDQQLPDAPRSTVPYRT
jgi:hypothetical protein